MTFPPEDIYEMFNNEESLVYDADPNNNTGEIIDYTCDIVMENQKELGQFKRIFIPLLYSLVFVIGVMGNGLVLYILMRHRRLRSSTDNFLVHLAIADLLMLFTFPFTVAEPLGGWVFGNYLCKIVRVISRVNFYCSSLLLGCISIDRYLSIIHAINAFRKQRAMTVHIPCFGVWFFCFLLSSPNLFILGTIPEGCARSRCGYYNSNFRDNKFWQAERFINHLVGFLFPMLLMTFCYFHIIVTLCKSPRREKKRAVRVAIVITSVFFLCWTPYNVVIFVNTLKQLGQIEGFRQIRLAVLITELLGYVHCCLNPLLYAFVGVKFRKDAMNVLKHTACFKSKMISKLNMLQRKGSAIESESGTMMSSF
ncbi:PREDICTED: C-X-C chemokine receptor type 5 [Nanorana parkeri]|uniref:C-X-C chemokine receptor type 5 n=1 Tax=Nanorana parkeri TaxID=125878 RepID=UPI00085502FE|nr:PREDICTED: C-X-C chemokine receptor type 5 [Nanorana parkeri]